MRYWILIIYLLFEQMLVSAPNVGKVQYDPKPEEGYFQGWNYSYRDKDTILFATFLVSNLGPGSLNNGVSLYIQSKKTGIFYTTKEFADYDMVAVPGSIGQKSGDNFFRRDPDGLSLTINIDSVNLDLKFLTSKIPVLALSDGEYSLSPFSGFLRADIGFTRVRAIGQLKFQDEIIPLNGFGSMEHLNTNVEVYKFSKSWEILRSFSQNGMKFYYGGFTATEDFPKKFFKRYAILNEKNEILSSGEVKEIEVETWLMNSFSGYNLPVQQKLILDHPNNCVARIQDSRDIGEINVLSNISVVLRLFIRMFFAKPYQIHKETKVELKCEGDESQNFIFNTGVHSYYLINR